MTACSLLGLKGEIASFMMTSLQKCSYVELKQWQTASELMWPLLTPAKGFYNNETCKRKLLHLSENARY